MLRREKLLILIPAMLLIPILLGLTPLNMAHRLANGIPFIHGKQCCFNDRCLFNCLVSYDDLTAGILKSSPLDQELLHSQEVRIAVLDSFHSSIDSHFIPLRC